MSLQGHQRNFNWVITITLTLAIILLDTQPSWSSELIVTNKQEENCSLPQNLIEEIASYQGLADQIIGLVVNGEFRGRVFEQMARFVDKFPNRLTSGQGLEDAIDYMMDKMRADGLENVTAEPAQVTHWIRNELFGVFFSGKESADILLPIQKRMNILGLGPSVGTPEDGITAEVVVVHNYTELDAMQALVPGKIVVYNQGWLGSYGETAAYRNGAVAAARYGAVAALVESATPFSLDTPHTGSTRYSSEVNKIPIACITREDAQMLSRIYSRGENITIKLVLMDEPLPPTTSRNSFGQITGRELPDEIVAVSGHIDAWDVGQGAQDDAGGVVISVEAIALIKQLRLRPRRTLQAILWTAEEQGVEGAAAFMELHGAEMMKYKAVFEADLGTFRPYGLDFAGTPEAGCIVAEVLKLVESINATEFRAFPVVGSDISYMIEAGVPGLGLNNANENYFYYHHSPADMMTNHSPEDLDLNTALWAITSYVLADLSVTLPRANSTIIHDKP